jgi:hypothetical protein
MKSLANLLHQPAGRHLLADDVLELHAARLLLLVLLCGTKNKGTQTARIDGLTKMAKLDFLVRYPEFFERLAKQLGETAKAPIYTIESSMVRFHYGPWDQRYYHILAYLESRDLFKVEKEKSAFKFSLTEEGANVARTIVKMDSFGQLAEHMRLVKKLVGELSGTKLKNLIYQVFGKEVVDRKMGESIT